MFLSLCWPNQYPCRSISSARWISYPQFGWADFNIPGQQLLRLGQLATQFDSENARRYSFSPELLRPTTGRLRVALRAQVGDFIGLSASEWLMQFAVGFPLKGALSQQHAFKREEVPPNPPVPAVTLLINNTGRFVYRARRSPARLASTLWREKRWGKLTRGGRHPPALLTTDGGLYSRSGLRLQYRFSIWRFPRWKTYGVW